MRRALIGRAGLRSLVATRWHRILGRPVESVSFEDAHTLRRTGVALLCFVVCLACFMCARIASAHGGPPAVLSIVAASERGPSVVTLNEGLAVFRGERWSFLCPRLWGDGSLGSGRAPLAAAVHEREAWVAGTDDLYAIRIGRVIPQGRTELRASRLALLATGGDTLYGLRITDEGGSELVELGASAKRLNWISSAYHSAISADTRHIHLARQASERDLEFKTLERDGRLVLQSTLRVDRPVSRLEVHSTPSALFATTYDGVTSVLHRFDEVSWTRVVDGDGVLHGPRASSDGRLWIVLNGVLMREGITGFTPIGEPRPLTCLGAWAGKSYACAGDELYWLTENGLGERCFSLERLMGPDPKIVPPDAAHECDLQWTLFRNDLERAGLSPEAWSEPTPAAIGGSESSMPQPVNASCYVSTLHSNRTHSNLCVLSYFGWFGLSLLRRRSRALAVGAGAALLALHLAPSAGGRPPLNVEARSLAVAEYDGGEITVGELEDVIATSSPLAQQEALQPSALRSLLARSLQFELMALEAERRGYGSRPAVLDAIKQNRVHRMLATEVDAKLPAELRALDKASPSPERDALVEGLIANLRNTEPTVLRPELISHIELEAF